MKNPSGRIPTPYHGNIKVLMYHRIVNHPPAHGARYHWVEANNFQKQLELLERWNFTPVTFLDLVHHLEGRLTLPPKPVILTFDDGYLDTYEQAVPILKSMNMTAVIYALGNRSLTCSEWDRNGDEPTPELMNDRQLRDLRQQGFEIGTHTMNHLALSDLSDYEIREELASSKASLEAVLGEPVCSISYPYGSVNEQVQDAARKAGYKFGCGVFTGPAQFGEEPYDIRRIAIHHHLNQMQFLMRLLTPYEYAESIYSRYRHRHASKKASPATPLQTEPPVS